MGRNICHGSDAVESAKKEIALWFPEGVVQYGLTSAVNRSKPKPSRKETEQHRLLEAVTTSSAIVFSLSCEDEPEMRMNFLLALEGTEDLSLQLMTQFIFTSTVLPFNEPSLAMDLPYKLNNTVCIFPERIQPLNNLDDRLLWADSPLLAYLTAQFRADRAEHQTPEPGNIRGTFHISDGATQAQIPEPSEHLTLKTQCKLAFTASDNRNTEAHSVTQTTQTLIVRWCTSRLSWIFSREDHSNVDIIYPRIIIFNFQGFNDVVVLNDVASSAIGLPLCSYRATGD
ncbi:hypothetical protein CROQUDRAFT_93396 [Cronartium quercuum f. sp. fusiforme G11]|uniref:Nucleoside-diphosphate kinase n=1 Tax=Cronartium quercuum f. sp. fusiforme G11 TaxID=708437 RepID=A0A9P6TB25_9BASI|nr:hypothetical protein CROQUDRAFT_93396 [Cronartium quercuum f. sp. fusiforme G11]